MENTGIVEEEADTLESLFVLRDPNTEVFYFRGISMVGMQVGEGCEKYRNFFFKWLNWFTDSCKWGA